MLIDWVTCRLPESCLSAESWRVLSGMGDRIARYSAATGEVVWESTAWDSMRSDSHAIALRLGSDALWLQGSPARVIGQGCAVFGEGSAFQLDLAGCVAAMVQFAGSMVGLNLPSYMSWLVTRVDVTGNLMLDNQAQVREALTVLRDCEGGRYRVSQQAGDTVYWSHKSKLRKGKAYAKGAHLRYQMKRKGYDGYQYDENQLTLAEKLLRLELTLGSVWFKRQPDAWFDLTPHQLIRQWEDYFL